MAGDSIPLDIFNQGAAVQQHDAKPPAQGDFAQQILADLGASEQARAEARQQVGEPQEMLPASGAGLDMTQAPEVPPSLLQLQEAIRQSEAPDPVAPVPPQVPQLQPQQPYPAPQQPVAQPAPAAPPPPAEPSLTEQLLQQQMQQTAQLTQVMQQMQQGQELARQQFEAQRSPHQRAEEMVAAGLDPSDPKDVHLYEMDRRAAQQEQQLQALQAHLQGYQVNAQQVMQREHAAQATRQAVASRLGRELPEQTMAHLRASVQQAVAQGHPADQAAAAAVAAIAPLVQQPPAQPAPPNPLAPPPPGVHPGLAHIQQLPQFAGLPQAAQVGLHQGMQAVSVSGQGAGRHPAPDFDQVTSMLFRN